MSSYKQKRASLVELLNVRFKYPLLEKVCYNNAKRVYSSLNELEKANFEYELVDSNNRDYFEFVRKVREDLKYGN